MSGSGAKDSGADVPTDAVGLRPEGSDATTDTLADTSEGGSETVSDATSNVVPDVGAPPLDANAQLRGLTNAQLGELCNWENAAFGGYGRTSACRMNAMSQYLCVTFGPWQQYCGQTVADLVACTYAELAEMPACDEPAECQVLDALCPDGSTGGSFEVGGGATQGE